MVMFEDQSWQRNIPLGNICRVVLWRTSAPCWLGMRCWSLPSWLILARRAGSLCGTRSSRLFRQDGGPSVSAGSAACTRSAIFARPSTCGVTSLLLPGCLWWAGRQCHVGSLCRVGNLCRAIRPWRYISCRDCICRLLRHLPHTFLVHSCLSSLKRHCWQHSWLSPHLRKWDQEISAQLLAKMKADHVTPPSCDSDRLRHQTRYKLLFLTNAKYTSLIC